MSLKVIKNAMSLRHPFIGTFEPLSKMIQTISMGHIMLLLYFFSVGFKMNVLFGARFECLILDLTRC